MGVAIKITNGDRMRRAISEQLLSQERLAYDAGVDRSYVGGVERREENPTVDILDRLAAALGVPLADLFAVPAKGAPSPEPLAKGRKPTR